MATEIILKKEIILFKDLEPARPINGWLARLRHFDHEQ
jgi:hypothetical protein